MSILSYLRALFTRRIVFEPEPFERSFYWHKERKHAVEPVTLFWETEPGWFCQTCNVWSTCTHKQFKQYFRFSAPTKQVDA